MADRVSSLRRIRVTPSRWRRSVSASASTRTSTTSTLPSYTQMEAVKLSAEQDTLVFQFPFPPEKVNYTEMAPEMVAIDRLGRKPLVLWNRPRAKRISLQFLVAVPNDGMFIDIEDALETLQTIADSTRPVVFSNTDGFLGAPGSYTGGELTFWTIMDLTFESVRRNAGQRITSAQVSMSLIENSNPLLEVIQLAPIEYTEIAPVQNPLKEDAPAPEILDYTDVDQRYNPRPIAWPDYRPDEDEED